MKNNILNKIIEHKKKWIQYHKKKFPINAFYKNIRKSQKDVQSILKKNHPFFIFECKNSSPTFKNIRKNFNIVNILKNYNKYADIISIVTEDKFFNGNYEYLLEAHKNTNKPLLCKDFIIDPYQIYYARFCHANIILLILSILDDKTYILLSNIAKKLNLKIITEINNKEELNRAILLKSEIIGINNRNLKDLSINLNTTRKLAPFISDRIIISESGINNYRDVRSLSKIVDGFLIGTHLMRSKNIEFSIKKLIYGENKICGLTKPKDAQIAYNNGSIYGGLIFCKYSKRKVDIQKSQEIVVSASLKYIGVFCNDSIKKIIKLVNLLSLYGVQLHGQEDQIFITKLRAILPEKVEIWKSLPVYLDYPKKKFNYVNKYLLDNKTGGTGQSFNWKIIKNQDISDTILAGGININNVFSASQLGFCGLDINSGVELSPGLKNKKKIKLIFDLLKNFPLRSL